MTGLSPIERYWLTTVGLLVRRDILDAPVAASIRRQIAAASLPPPRPESEQHNVPGLPAGDAQILLNHPRIMDVVHEVVHGHPRIERVSPMVFGGEGRPSGVSRWDLAGEPDDVGAVMDGPSGPRSLLLHVWVELDAVVRVEDAMSFIPGSHRARDRPTLMESGEDPLSRRIGPAHEELPSMWRPCSAGSVMFHFGGLALRQSWTSDRARHVLLLTYSHPAVAYSRNAPILDNLLALPPAERALFRDAWHYDFSQDPPVRNTVDRLLFE